MQNKTILIIEDEKDILELLEYTLQKEGYDTIGFLYVDKNLEKVLEQEEIDLILIDRNLQGYEGTNFIKKIKSQGYDQAVIYLTAKDKDEDILDGFECYADDYITKPFNLKELHARIKAVLRRTLKEIELLKVKDIVYNGAKKRFSIGGEELDLSPLEHDLLLEFIKNKNILLSRDYLLNTIWEDAIETKSKTVNVAIKRLKEKIDPKGEKQYIKSIRGEGYMFC